MSSNSDTRTFHHNRIDLLITGHSFQMPQTRDLLISQWQATRYRDALRVLPAQGEIWLFDYGILVCWGVDDKDKQALLAQLKDLIEQPLSDKHLEEYAFEQQADTLRIHNDTLTLPDDDFMLRLAVSHAFAQSSKLILLEDKAQSVIAEHRDLAKNLAKTGRIPLSRRELSKLRGVLFETRSDILLNFNLLDTPEFFWDYPELEPAYATVARYLDLMPRIDVLSRKLETIHELVDMLAGEQNHRHSSTLEWIIIALIAVEIVMNFPHF